MKRLIAFFIPFTLAFFFMSNKTLDYKPGNNQTDGPYVFYKEDKVHVNYILNDNGTNKLKLTVPLSQKESIKLTIATDREDISFEVALKKDLQNEKTDFSGVTKMFVVSDIEGEFKAFRELLQGNNIIDDKFNWTFGNGHLVLTGDFVDRGNRVTEVLWFIYSLEEKAKAAGGHVHFILGNHEIMNLNNDLRYVHPKYIESAALMNESYLNLYSEHTELGRWFRTKNVIEKIGNVLFMHAGISTEINEMDMSVSKINKLVRPCYGNTSGKYNSSKVEMLYSDAGPFWYRGYYGKEKPSIDQIEHVLSSYKVKHIATGHTVIADTVSVLYNGKLFNTDVHHAGGHSEGLLIDGNKFYRATPTGEKFLILD
ncbi:MAG: metallophosphoesterase [Chitinophagaceae bacterium]